MAALRAKSVRLTTYLEWLIETEIGDAVQIVTPREPGRRGAQLSVRVPGGADRIQARMQESGVVGDSRPPDVLRLAPSPLFNTFREMWRTARVLREAVRERA